MAQTIQTLMEEVRRLTAVVASLSKNTPTPTPTTTHPNTDNLTAPNPKRPKTTPNPKLTKPTNILFPLFNTFDVLRNHRDTDNTTDFPPPPPTQNDPTAVVPTKLSNRTTLTRPIQPRQPLNATTAPMASPIFAKTTPVPKTADTIPPIILHHKESWFHISTVLNARKASYSRATNTREGIRIIPATIQDYRTIHDILTNEQQSFHSFQLPSEKTIKVVIRGVPQSLTEEQILTDLTNKSYVPLLVHRLNGRNNLPAPLILVQVKWKYSSIFNLKTLCGLDVSVQAKKVPSGPLQCHRCQRFGHTQPNCHAPYRCMKCAESHSTPLCPKPVTTPAVCANCNLNHISSHHSCAQNPTNLKK